MAGFVTSIRIEAELKERLLETAEREGLSLSEWARRAFAEALARGSETHEPRAALPI